VTRRFAIIGIEDLNVRGLMQRFYSVRPEGPDDETGINNVWPVRGER